jgi:hypothetical protein
MIITLPDHLLLTPSQCRGCRASAFDVERGRYGVLLRCRSCELTTMVRVRCTGTDGMSAGIARASVQSGDVVCDGCGERLPLPAPVGVS